MKVLGLAVAWQPRASLSSINAMAIQRTGLRFTAVLALLLQSKAASVGRGLHYFLPGDSRVCTCQCMEYAAELES